MINRRRKKVQDGRVEILMTQSSYKHVRKRRTPGEKKGKEDAAQKTMAINEETKAIIGRSFPLSTW